MKFSKTYTPPGTDASADRFASMPTVRLAVLAGMMWEHGELLYGRLFGLRTIECRMVGAVQAFQPLSLRRACVELNIDKSLGSRMVGKLVDAGLLERRPDPDDQRSFYMLLSPAGHAMHARILEAAVDRNRAWLDAMPGAALADFLGHIERQTACARTLLDAERARQGSAPTRASSEQPAPSSASGPLLVDREALLDMHRRIGALLAANGVDVASDTSAVEHHGRVRNQP